MIRILLITAVFFSIACFAQAPPAVIKIHVPKNQAQRAIDEGELIQLLREDFQNMDESRGTVDMALRRHMDAIMKRLMTKNMWVEP